MINKEIADIFYAFADLLEIKDENPFKIRAYRRAAESLQAQSWDIESLIKEENLKSIPGVGDDLARKIKEYALTAHIQAYDDLIKKVPAELLLMLKVPGLGPKKVKMLYERLGLDSVDKLEKLARDKKLRGLPGIGEKTEENILRGILFLKKGSQKMPLGAALPLAEEIIAELKNKGGIERISYAGSLRRKKESVRDIDILVSSKKPQLVMDNFSRLSCVDKVLLKGGTKSSIMTKSRIQVDLRVVKESSYGAALQYFTGSKNHNIKLRALAQKKGFTINEYGIFKEKNKEKIAGKEESDIYKALKLKLIPPELREDSGEIEAAISGDLPDLIELKDIRGDLHVHSNWSDGAESLEKIIEAAYKKGYQYAAITDHSKSLKVANGLSEKRLREQIKEIKKINKKYKDFYALCGTEVDIKSDGSLDMEKDILRELDIVVASIHTGFKQGKDKITFRIEKAIKSGLVDIIAHPTARLMGEREGYEIDWERIFSAAAEYKVALEINSYYMRLDLDDIHAKAAKERGVLVSINTDAHLQNHLDMIEYGISVARRGWLEKKNVLNAMQYEKLIKYLETRSKDI